MIHSECRNDTLDVQVDMSLGKCGLVVCKVQKCLTSLCMDDGRAWVMHMHKYPNCNGSNIKMGSCTKCKEPKEWEKKGGGTLGEQGTYQVRDPCSSVEMSWKVLLLDM